MKLIIDYLVHTDETTRIHREKLRKVELVKRNQNGSVYVKFMDLVPARVFASNDVVNFEVTSYDE